MKLGLIIFLFSYGVSLFAALPHPEAPFVAMTSDEVKSYQHQLMRSIADLALIPPDINTTSLSKYDPSQLDYGMTIGVESTPGGRLWAAWIGGEDGPGAFMLAATSDDDGETWSKPRLVINAQDASLPFHRTVLIGNFWTDPLGRLWLFFDQSMNQFDGRAGLWATLCENPDSDEPIWSKPRRISNGSMLNKPTVLSTGEWLLPAYLIKHTTGIGPFKDTFPELDPMRGINILISSDQGATWSLRAAVPFPNPDWFEPMVVERKDGSLWMWVRTTKGIAESISKDRGFTWSEPSYPTNIKHPNARFFLRRLASGRVLLIKHGDQIDAHQGRVKLSAWLSEDEGESWQGGLVIEDRSGVTYPDGFQSKDGMIYISYDHQRSTHGEVLLARFTEEDILTGKLVSPRSKLKMMISRPMKGKTPAPVSDAKAVIPDFSLNSNAKADPLRTQPVAQIEAPNGQIRKLVEDELVFSNRPYRFLSLPTELAGKRFVFSEIEQSTVNCVKAGMVYVLAPSEERTHRGNANVEAELLRQGFVKASIPEFVIMSIQGEISPFEASSVFQKKLNAGDTVEIHKWGVFVF
ncbi:sialidase family protein [Coraliomargarita sp. W4R72]